MIGFATMLLGTAGLWVLYVAGIKPEEMIVGAICVLLTVAFSSYVRSQCVIDARPRVRDVVQLWRVPWCVLIGSWEVSRVFVKDILRLAPAESLFRAAPYRETGEEPEIVARRVLAVTYTTATPNFIILGIDTKSQRMLFHQISKGDVRTMTRNLGAHP